MDNLPKRGIKVNHRCYRCRDGSETTMHMIVMCSEACTLWRLSLARVEVSEWEGEFKEWCELVAKSCTLERGMGNNHDGHMAGMEHTQYMGV